MLAPSASTRAQEDAAWPTDQPRSPATPGEGLRHPLEDFHVADVALFTSDTHWPWFERLRAEDPVHYCPRANTAPTGR